MALHSGVYFSSLYPEEEGRAAQGSACLPLSKILWLPQRIIISIILSCANLVNSNTVDLALAQGLLSSHLQPRICLGHRLATLSASLLCMGPLQMLVPKRMLLLRVKTWRNFLPQRTWAGTQSIFTFVFSSKSCGLKLSTHISIPSYLHLSPNKCESRQRQLLCLRHHTLVLWRWAGSQAHDATDIQLEYVERWCDSSRATALGSCCGHCGCFSFMLS